MSMLLRILSALSAVIMIYTVLDGLSFMLTGISLSNNFFGGGSPVSEAVLEMIPGMSPAEFLLVNISAIVFISAISVLCIWYCFYADRRPEVRNR